MPGTPIGLRLMDHEKCALAGSDGRVVHSVLSVRSRREAAMTRPVDRGGEDCDKQIFASQFFEKFPYRRGRGSGSADRFGYLCAIARAAYEVPNRAARADRGYNLAVSDVHGQSHEPMA